MKLDAKTPSTVTLGDKADAIFWDDLIRGFGLRLRRDSKGQVSKTWIAQYRIDGRQRRPAIGDANVVSAKQARQAAKKLLARVQVGEDPQGAKAERREKDEMSFRKVASDFLEDKASAIRSRTGAPIRKRTMVELQRYLTGNAYFRPLHLMAIDKIERRKIATQLLTIKRELGHTTAARARSALSALFVWAMKQGLVEANPVIGTDKPGSAPRERVLDNAELATLWKNADGDFGRIVKLLILTGARRTEIGGMLESELDRDAGTWTLPAERAKNNHELTLALPSLAWDVIGPARAGRESVFGDRVDTGFTDWDKSKKRLDAKIGDAITTKWNLHDCRRSTATGMADIGVQPHVIEAVLNHQSGHKAGNAGVYNKSPYTNEVRAALALWADHIEALVEGSKRKIIAYPVAAT